MDSKLLESTWPYSVSNALMVPEVYARVGKRLGDKKATAKANAMLEKTMERMAQYLAYNREIGMKFGNAPMTLESRMMPYQFYRFIELYTENGGDRKKVDAIIAKTGFTLDELKRQYEYAYKGGADPSGDVATSTEYVSEEDLIGEPQRRGEDSEQPCGHGSPRNTPRSRRNISISTRYTRKPSASMPSR